MGTYDPHLNTLSDDELYNLAEAIRREHNRRREARHAAMVAAYKPPESYHQEYRRCQSPTCQSCNAGPGHGPYWYARSYNMYTGQRRKRYVGKEKPASL